MKRLLDWFRDFEPALLRSWYVAGVALLANLGVTLGTDLEGEIGFWLGVGIVLLTQLQAILTRFGVFAPATVQAEIDAAVDLAKMDREG